MKSLPLLGLAGLASLGALAQSAESLDPIVVTATRTAQSLDRSLRDVTVITREEIAAAGKISFAELLQRKANVEIRVTGGAGQPASIFLRGANAQQTLVLVDGMRVGSATVGNTAVENLPLDLMERIEVVKGPLSSLYGSDAMGGVIQIFTRGADQSRLFASLTGGTPGDYSGNAGFTYAGASTTISLSAGARAVDAANITNEKSFCYDPDRDPYRNAYFNFRARQDFASDQSLSLYAFGSRGKTHFDGCADFNGVAYDDQNAQTLSGASLASSNRITGAWVSRLTLGQGRDKLKITGSFPSNFKTVQNQASWLNDVAIPGGSVLLGAETLRQAVQPASEFTTSKRSTNAVFGSVREAWHEQVVEASLRYDRDGQFGGRTTGLASYGIAIGEWGSLSAVYGKGFRAPTFYDLYGPSSDFYVPNPALQPERSTSAEARWRLPALAGWNTSITCFDNRIEDLIQYVFPTVENLRNATIRGTQVELRGALGKFIVVASGTWQDPVDDQTGKQLQGRAKSFGSLDISRSWGDWRVSAWVTGTGARYDSNTEAPSTRLPGYAVAGANVRYRLDREWSLDLTGNNLGNTKYSLATGYTQPGSTVLLTIRYDAP
jgi:vitamin B12 transporter